LKNKKLLIKHLPVIAISAVLMVALCLIPTIISEVNKHTHIYGDWERDRDPTCSAQGIDVRYCDCGHVQQRTVDKLPHTIDDKWVFNKDETEKHYFCSVCNQVAKIENLGDHTHSFGEWIVEIEPTCSEGGLYSRSCRCGARQEKAIATKDHILDKWKTIQESTCSVKGIKESVCQVCGYSVQEELKLKEHDFGKWIILENVSCIEEGLQERECKNCGEIEEKIIKITDHTFGAWETVIESTCTSYGLRQSKCKCGETKEEKIPMLDHNYTSTITLKLPTCTEEGIKESTCSMCKATITESIPQRQQHDYGNYETVVKETCGADGIKRRSCECGAYEEKPIPKTNKHSFGSWKIIKEAEYNIDGSREKSCSVCGLIETEIIPALEYNPVDWSISNGTLNGVSDTVSGSITIPNEVKTISKGAFDQNRNISSVTMTGVRNINTKAFNACRNLSSVDISSSVTNIGEWAFDNCPALKSIYYEGTVEEWKVLMEKIEWHLGILTSYKVYCADGTISVSGTSSRPVISFE